MWFACSSTRIRIRRFSQIEEVLANIETTLQMIAKSSVQLEETRVVLHDKEADLQALRTAHETLRKILRKQVRVSVSVNGRLSAHFDSVTRPVRIRLSHLCCVFFLLPSCAFGP